MYFVNYMVFMDVASALFINIYLMEINKMHIPSTIFAVSLTVSVGAFSTAQLNGMFEKVNNINYENLEEITKETSISDAKDIIRKNNKRRQLLTVKLSNAIQK